MECEGERTWSSVVQGQRKQTSCSREEKEKGRRGAGGENSSSTFCSVWALKEWLMPIPIGDFLSSVWGFKY